MNAQLALALLAVGPIKAGLNPAATAAAPQQKEAIPAKGVDPIAFLAREWLAKR